MSIQPSHIRKTSGLAAWADFQNLSCGGIESSRGKVNEAVRSANAQDAIWLEVMGRSPQE